MEVLYLNIQVDYSWRSLACKRYKQYFNRRRVVIVKMKQHDIIRLTKETQIFII